MRPSIVAFLEPVLGRSLAGYLTPTGTTMIAAAILAVLWVMTVRGRRSGLAPRVIILAGAVAVAGGLVGARLFHLLLHARHTLGHPQLLLRLSGGTASWGAYLGGTAAFALFLRRRRAPVLPHLDVLASALGLGPFLARWSCVLNGCCSGTISDAPWAVRYPPHSIPFAAQVRTGQLDPAAALSLPVHPVQIYASLAGLVVFLATSRFWAVHRERPGATLAFYWLVYAVLRFATEFHRADVPRVLGTGLTLSQLIALAIVAAAGFGLRRALAGGGRRTEAAR